MKRKINTLIAFCSAMLLLMATGCEKGSDNRRDPENGGNDNPPAGKYIENPSWVLSYRGRTVSVSEYGTYIVDVINMDSDDDRDYYVDIVDSDTFAEDYNSDIERLLDDITIDTDWIDNGSVDCSFDMLDLSGGKWVAVAIEVAGGKKGSLYSMVEFITEDVTYKKDDSWKISYKPRVTIVEDGEDVVVDAITVEPNGCDYSYYVEIAYPEYIDENYNGDVIDFFNDVLDGLAETLGEDEDFSGIVYNNKTTLNFDRLRSGEWTAYAFGVDNRGYLTGNWSALDFTAPEEKATPEFEKWLGTWRIGGAGGGYDHEKEEPLTGYYYYDITISSSENNQYYLINDWETGISANDFANTYCPEYQFETAFMPENGGMQFLSTYLGTIEDQEYGYLDVMLLGMIEDGGEDYYITEEYVPLATATLNADGSKADVRPEQVSTEDGIYTFKAFQYMDVSDEYLFIYNDAVPYLTMTMEKISDATSVSAKPLARPLPAGRRVVASENIVSKAAGAVPAHRPHSGSPVRRTVSAPASKAPRKAAGNKARKASGRRG